MENPKIETRVEHSQSKKAWNVIGKTLGKTYKVARVPYHHEERESETTARLNEMWMQEAYRHAKFISYCFNNSTKICETKACV